MDDRRRLISELEERSKKNSDLRTEACAALGKYAAEIPGDKIPPGPLAAAIAETRTLRKSIDGNAAKSGRIREIVKRLDECRGELRILEAEAERIEKENLPIYEQFGRTAFEESAEDPLLPEAAGLFAAIRNLQADVTATDEKVSSLKETPKEKPFLTKLFEGGRVIFLNSSKTLKLRNLQKQYQNLGRTLLEGAEIPEGREYLLSYADNRKTLEKNRVKAETLKAELAALDEELIRLGVEKRYQKRLKDLEIQNDKLNERLLKLFGTIGAEVFEKHPDLAAGDEKLETLAADIRLYGKRSEENAAELEKLKTAIVYDGLNRRLHDLKRELEAEEEEMRSRRARIDVLRASIAEAEKEKKQLEKPRRSERM